MSEPLERIREGDEVQLLRRSAAHRYGTQVYVGAVGVVRKLRRLPDDDGPQALVKFVGCGSLKSTPVADLERRNA